MGPKVITLCGSTRFRKEYEEWNKRLSLEGNAVFSVALFGRTPSDFGKEMNEELTDKEKEILDEVHRRKIDLSDMIFVLNVGGYIGSSTQSEIEYAKSRGKGIIFLESRE